MTYGIAAYKVTPQFCEEEVNYITGIGGIQIKYNQQLGKDISLEELQKKGWVIQSTSRTEQGKQTYLLKRPKPGRDAGGTQLMSSKRGGSSGPVSGAR